MNEQGTNGQSTTSRSGFSGTSLLLMFLGGTLTGAAVAYLAQTENRARVRTLAIRTQQTAGHLPQAVREATHAAKEAFTESYSINGDPVAAMKG